MSASQIASLVPGGVSTSPPAAPTTRTTVLPDTGRISGNVLVLAASLASGQEQSNCHLGEMSGHLHEIRSHLKTLAEGSTQLNAALGVHQGDPANPPTFNSTIDQQSIDRLVSCLTDALQPKFAAQSAATAAVAKRVDEHSAQIAENRHDIATAGSLVLGEESQLAALHRQIGRLAGQVEGLRGRQSGDEITGGIVAAVTQEQMSELTIAVDQLKTQVGELLARSIPGSRGEPNTTQAASHTPPAHTRPRGGRG